MEESPTNDPSIDSARYFNIGKDIWIRARTNSLANKIASQRLSLTSSTIFILQMIFVVIPIVCVGLSISMTSVSGKTTATTSQAASGLSLIAFLSIISITSNGFALFLGVLSSRFKWSERSVQHRYLSSSFAIIAQRIRRLETYGNNVTDMKQLTNNLQETFEIYKSNALEPNDRIFSKAQMNMLKLKPYPLGITEEDLTTYN